MRIGRVLVCFLIVYSSPSWTQANCAFILKTKPLRSVTLSLEEMESHSSKSAREKISPHIVNLKIQNGLLFSNNQPFDTEGGTWTDKRGDVTPVNRAIVAVDKKGQLLASKVSIEDELHHSHLIHNEDALFAGEIETDKSGRLTKVNNRSGHYFTPLYHLKKFLLSLQEKGVDLSAVKVEVYSLRESMLSLWAEDFISASQAKSDSIYDIVFRHMLKSEPPKVSSNMGPHPQHLSRVLFGSAQTMAHFFSVANDKKKKKINQAIKKWLVYYFSDPLTREALTYFAAEEITKNSQQWGFGVFFDALEENLPHPAWPELALLRLLSTAFMAPQTPANTFWLESATQLLSLEKTFIQRATSAALVLNGSTNQLALKIFCEALSKEELSLMEYEAWTKSLQQRPQLLSNLQIFSAVEEAAVNVEQYRHFRPEIEQMLRSLLNR